VYALQDPLLTPSSSQAFVMGKGGQLLQELGRAVSSGSAQTGRLDMAADTLTTAGMAAAEAWARVTKDATASAVNHTTAVHLSRKVGQAANAQAGNAEGTDFEAALQASKPLCGAIYADKDYKKLPECMKVGGVCAADCDVARPLVAGDRVLHHCTGAMAAWRSTTGTSP
jgi:hypothetical protein